ncbi:CPBP family intramembrane glutamic endopeptidase [Streptomyces sp. NPDC058682]|uniref:CPBP family intramembrane glutamic endopeptidase n=1 Tax=Streptomyces sp. NPDC058682 TaxID=3346596 RepID=UPI0036510FCF
MDRFLLTTLAVWSLAPMPLATRVHGRWLEDRWPRLSTLTVYLVILCLLAVAGGLLLGPGVLHDGPYYRMLLCVPAGLALGRAAQSADRRITRHFAARARARARTAAKGRLPGAPVVPRSGAPRPVGLAARARPVGLAAGRPAPTAARGEDRDGRGNRWSAKERDRETRVGLGSLLAGAVLEETVFRGVLGRLGLDVGGVAGGVLFALAAAAFCLTHVPFGWPQALAKLPLSLMTTAAFLLSGGIVAGLVGHALFNWEYWRYQRALGTTGER